MGSSPQTLIALQEQTSELQNVLLQSRLLKQQGLNGNIEAARSSPRKPRWHWRKETPFDKNRVGLKLRLFRSSKVFCHSMPGSRLRKEATLEGTNFISLPCTDRGSLRLIFTQNSLPSGGVAVLSFHTFHLPTLSYFLTASRQACADHSFPLKSPAFILPQILFLLARIFLVSRCLTG